MEEQALPLDMMSKLPSNILQTILTLLPMREAFRTSILSRNWRDHCLSIPKLEFDDETFARLTYNLSIKCKLLHFIYPILLRHRGPVLEFSLCISGLISCCEIDQIILHLSRSATVKKFTLRIRYGDDHKLLPSFFILQQLTVLKLQNCAFQPPANFKGFSRLISLYFDNVSITVKVLLCFISNCPLLKSFTLIGDKTHLTGCWNSDVVELIECLPLIEYLRMDSYPIKCFATGVMPQKLPTSLIHLKYLHLSGLCFGRETELCTAFLLIASSPNIETIIMEMPYNLREVASETARNFFDLQDCTHVILDHLREIKITNFTNMKPGMDFVKLILAKSPMIKLVDIEIDEGVTTKTEVKMLKKLLQYERASAKAKIIVESFGVW